MGGGRSEGSSATGDGGQAAVSLTPNVDGTGSGSLLEPDASIFESSQLESSRVAGRPYDLHPAAPLIFPPHHCLFPLKHNTLA